jgi:hypothetical protein
LTTGPTPAIVWLPQSASTPTAPPGKLAQFKAKLKHIAAPVLRPFRRKPSQIQVNWSLMRRAPDALELTGLGTPIGTNVDGLRAWVLERAQLQTITSKLDTRMGEDASHSVTIFDGTQLNTGVGASSFKNGVNDSIRLQVNFAPKAVSGSVQLIVGVTWNRGAITPSNSNLIACRALIPNGCALVIDCPQAKAAAGKNYWFSFSPIIQ